MANMEHTDRRAYVHKGSRRTAGGIPSYLRERCFQEYFEVNGTKFSLARIGEWFAFFPRPIEHLGGMSGRGYPFRREGVDTPEKVNELLDTVADEYGTAPKAEWFATEDDGECENIADIDALMGPHYPVRFPVKSDLEPCYEGFNGSTIGYSIVRIGDRFCAFLDASHLTELGTLTVGPIRVVGADTPERARNAVWLLTGRIRSLCREKGYDPGKQP